MAVLDEGDYEIVRRDTIRNEHEVTTATSINDISRDLAFWMAGRNFPGRPREPSAQAWRASSISSWERPMKFHHHFIRIYFRRSEAFESIKVSKSQHRSTSGQSDSPEIASCSQARRSASHLELSRRDGTSLTCLLRPKDEDGQPGSPNR